MAAIGGFIGHFFTIEKWENIPLKDIRLSVFAGPNALGFSCSVPLKFFFSK